MKKTYIILTLLLSVFIQPAYSQNNGDTAVYLLTCNPTSLHLHSIYGHSALRIVDNHAGTDTVYDWGAFDSETSNLAWKFATGRLDYTLQSRTATDFLQACADEERRVTSQRINLNPDDVQRLLSLIEENLKPENAGYRYNAFYDNCATRIRDILEKATNGKIHYPSAIDIDTRSFRDMVSEYQKQYLWLNFGINLALGLPANKKVSFRDKMFLPFELQQCLTTTVIQTEGRLVPLLQNPETVIKADTPAVQSQKLLSPENIIAIFLVLMTVTMPFIRRNKYIRAIDISVFSLFSLLACAMLFCNFFTNHQLTTMNINIIWLNPIIILCLVSLLMNKGGAIWFRVVFSVSALFLFVLIIIPHEFPRAALPLCFILALRSSARSAFDWNPINVDNDKP